MVDVKSLVRRHGALTGRELHVVLGGECVLVVVVEGARRLLDVVIVHLLTRDWLGRVRAVNLSLELVCS